MAIVVMTPADDALVASMRQAGNTWASIGLVFGVPAGTVCNRYLGIMRRARRGHESPKFNDERQPLPAGHPATWGIICAAPFPANERTH